MVCVCVCGVGGRGGGGEEIIGEGLGLLALITKPPRHFHNQHASRHLFIISSSYLLKLETGNAVRGGTNMEFSAISGGNV